MTAINFHGIVTEALTEQPQPINLARVKNDLKKRFNITKESLQNRCKTLDVEFK